MPVAVRSYVATGLALMGTGVVTAGQIALPLQKSENRIVEAAVNLVAAVGNGQACSGYNTDGCDIWATPTYKPVAADPSGSAANIPANLFNAIASVPRAWLDGLNELSYALEVTGNWWVYTPTNVLGFDPADPPKITALIDQLIPFKPLSHAIGDQLAWWARANLPMNDGCTGSVGPACADAGAILGVMFKAPIWTLASGYQFPELYNPVSNAEGDLGDLIPGSVGEKVPWSGASVKLNTSDWITSVVNYLQADPSANAPKPITLPEIGAALDRFVKALVIAFNPFVPRSYLLKGWPYTALTPLFLPFVPALCKTCNPDNPGGPPLGWTPSPAAAVPPAELVSAKVDVPPAPATGEKPDDPAPGSPAGDSAAVSGTPGNQPSDNDGPSDRTATTEAATPAAADGALATSAVATNDVPVTDAAATDAPATQDVTTTDTASTVPAATSTPASRASSARSAYPDLAPVDVAIASDNAAAPSQSAKRPHRGAPAGHSASTSNGQGAASSAASADSTDKSGE